MSYNLVDEQWIPVLGIDGSAHRVGIRQVLTQAGSIRQIASSNPMDNVAILRFLMAVLLWCKPDVTDAVWESLHDMQGIPAGWLRRLDEFGNKFNLLGAGDRFYQDEQLWKQGKRRPIGDLLQEFPTDTKIAHFRHIRDYKYGLCPACCAMGVVRLCTFANYAGKGYTSAINGPAPAYAIPLGKTLQQTLMLNLPKGESKRKAPWLYDTAPSVSELDALTVFAWRSRRFWLGDLEDCAEVCAYCGQSTRLIKQIAITGGWKPPFQTKGEKKKFWKHDPHLILEARRSGKDESDDDLEDCGDDETAADGSPTTNKVTEYTTIGFPRPGSRVRAHAGFWRRALVAVISRSGPEVPVFVAGPAASQTGMLYQDATALTLPPLSGDAQAAAHDVASALADITRQMSGLWSQSTPNPRRLHRNRKAALDAHSPLLEAHLREEFHNWIASLDRSAKNAQPPVGVWRAQLIEYLRPVVDTVTVSTTPGSALRRREAVSSARQALDRALAKRVRKNREETNQNSAEMTKREHRK